MAVSQLSDVRQQMSRLGDPVALLAGLFAHAPTAWQLCDAAGRTLQVNAAFGELFGVAPPDAWVLLDPIAQRAGRPDSIKAAFAGETVRIPSTWYDPSEPKPPGTSTGRRVAVEVTLLPLVKADGAVSHLAIAFKDVTARELLRAREESEAKAERIARIGNWQIDLAGGELERAAATWSHGCFEVFGVDPAATRPSAERLFECVHPADQAAFRDAVREAVRGRRPLLVEHRILRPNGEERVVVEHADLVCDEASGEPRRLFGIAQDVTEERRTAEQLRQAQKMEALGQLTGGIAHDFNNLLTVIEGYAESLRRRVGPGDERAAHAAAMISGAAERAAALTRQLLAFSRRQLLQPRPLSLNALVGGLAGMLARTLGETIELRTALDPNLGATHADPGQIEQVIVNLAVNARDAMPRGGLLLIETANVRLDAEYARRHAGVAPGAYVVLAVSDTGIGIDPETRKRIFEPFFTTKGPGKGTGLGLATVHGIVNQSGGHVFVYSELGKGTSFKVYFPRSDAPAEAGAAARPDGPLPRGSETVLLVEDDPMVRDYVLDGLLDLGYEAIAVPSPELALEALDGRDPVPDLVLTDVILPGMTGPDLALRARQRRPGLPVLFMSGYADDTIVHHGVLETGVPFIQKPFTVMDLACKLREVLDH